MLVRRLKRKLWEMQRNGEEIIHRSIKSIIKMKLVSNILQQIC